MATAQATDQNVSFSDKSQFLKLLEENDALTGFEFDPDVTAEELFRIMLEQGVRPEDNILSRDIIQSRYEDEA